MTDQRSGNEASRPASRTNARPAPRPALRKAADGDIHPASPQVARERQRRLGHCGPTLAVQSEQGSGPGVKDDGKRAAGKRAAGKDQPPKRGTEKRAAGKKGSGKGKGKSKSQGKGSEAASASRDVAVSIAVPQALYDRALAQAEVEGLTIEDALANLLRVWADR